MAKATVKLGPEGYRTIIKSGNHEYIADEPVDAGGTDTGPTPSEMLMGALGACIAITCRLYAERKKWPLEGVEIALESERFNGKDYADYDGDELFVHEIRKSIVFKGDLTDDQRERLLDIAGKCPVHRTIALPSFFKTELVDDILGEDSAEPLVRD
ncbi:MAG: OsmC family protein [Anaerolineae bacterium]|nr:OsmC family protein [Anaerolineae bacterium]MCA9887737.1 OsmC family protein [Anaerolineae bacterium]MCA9892100.1 OsmC family protein [Anaerolineae bacterium]MCB9458154.1 OsmC family protein [Anaerolineaceae bacterium]